MESFNLFDGELDDERTEPAGFTWRAAPVGPKLGGEKLGASVYELAARRASFPYHYEYGAEEWLHRRRRPADAPRPGRRARAACRGRRLFPEGPDGAHQVRNDSDEPVRVLIASTKQLPDAAVYPDSGKVGLWTGNEADPPRLFRIGDAVDYWDGEA